ncbi:H-NS family nucleoid-associated regulatory protein [Paraburkholderia caribensis]|uniref:Histone family protein nucleoid-structuring protein H-NS n=2 Tax=Paraburkholderia TaxID=1822464 RepID=B2JXK3_PARP8|nr:MULTISPECIES: H-NS family nucleoid-associated regulatory protein [Paraburkholderia]ACC76361.1 histone family protein nucleoid-structuring protein H-NS [Paraburkholderia phymatum STM815]MCO4882476.1 H-NS histone family protein [Paraburkholderia caribensis]PTB24234.1 histidine biosynthesis protein [Paraburkholderia caribensis]
MATLENLQAKIAKLQAQAAAIAKKDSSAVIAKIRDLMDKHGLTTADIDAHIGGATKRGRKPGAASAAKKAVPMAKYRDPKTGATWTGHGRAPAWIANAKDRSKYLVASGSVAPGSATTKPAKSGNYVRGVQPALYADVKTGATWSGRGRAPAWIAGARDRSKFLIAGMGQAKAEANAVGGKKAAPTKKAAVKKATAKKGAAVAKKAKTTAAPTKTSVVRKAAKKAVARRAPVSPVAGRTALDVASEGSGVTASA